MSRRSIAAFAVAVLAVIASGSRAEAQWVRGGFGGPRVFAGAGGPVALTPGYGYSSAYVAPGYSATGVAPYSYYVVPSQFPSRTYIGPTEFPFYGRPYGHPYDRWTWPYINGGANADLARYYYPPLG